MFTQELNFSRLNRKNIKKPQIPTPPPPPCIISTPKNRVRPFFRGQNPGRFRCILPPKNP